MPLARTTICLSLENRVNERSTEFYILSTQDPIFSSVTRRYGLLCVDLDTPTFTTDAEVYYVTESIARWYLELEPVWCAKLHAHSSDMHAHEPAAHRMPSRHVLAVVASVMQRV